MLLQWSSQHICIGFLAALAVAKPRHGHRHRHHGTPPRTPKHKQPGPGRPGPPRPRPRKNCFASVHECVQVHEKLLHVTWFSTAPPVEENFTTNCLRQSDKFPHITCEEDGSFTPVQCSGGPRGMCYCVNTTTGRRLNGMPHNVPVKERDTINCTKGELIQYMPH